MYKTITTTEWMDKYKPTTEEMLNRFPEDTPVENI